MVSYGFDKIFSESIMYRFKNKISNNEHRREYDGTKNGSDFDSKKKSTNVKDGCNESEQKCKP